MTRGSKKKRLRKQPKMRRVYSASALPLPVTPMPTTVRRRQRRNVQQRFAGPLSSIRRVVLTSRWISLAVLVLCVYGLMVIGRDERFYLDYLPVQGTGAVPPGEIVAISNLAGRHVFAADPQQAAEDIAALPGVNSATVTLQWPNEVLIEIQEDPPVAIWQEGDKTFWIVDNGSLIPARTETVGLLTIISETSEVKIRTSAEPAPDFINEESSVTTEGEEALNQERQALDEESATKIFIPTSVIAGALQLRSLRPNISQLYYRPSGGLSYQDGRGWRAHFGTGENMHQKLVVYETVVEDLLSKGLRPSYISVSNQKKPFYKLD